MTQESEGLDEAYRLLNDSLTLLTEDHAPTERAEALCILGDYHQQRGQRSEAEACWRDSERLYRQMEYVYKADDVSQRYRS